MNPAPDAAAFRLERYKLDREHELELYKATAQYEHAWIRTVTLLNGGTAGVFVTILGAIWKQNWQPRSIPAALALAAWAIGLIATTYATKKALDGQGKYAEGVRRRR